MKKSNFTYPPRNHSDIRIKGQSLIFDYTKFIFSVLFFGIFCTYFPTNIEYSIINFALGSECLFFLFLTGKNPYDLGQIFYLANFIFFGIAARIEKNLDIVYWGGDGSVLLYYEGVGIASLIGIFCFFVGYNIKGFKRYSLKRKFVTGKAEGNRVKVSHFALIALSSFSAVAIYYYNNWNIVSVFFRSGIEGERAELTGTQWLLFQSFLYPVPSVSAIIYLIFGQKSRAVTLLLILLMFSANPPTGMARWQASVLYGALFLTILPSVFNRRHLFALAQFCSLFLIFPILELFRRFTNEFNFQLDMTWMLGGSLDAAQNFARVVSHGFITYGYQLIGVVFFFVPRELWPDKPIGSGNQISGISNLYHNNISMPFLGEGYINFGYLGVLIFPLFLGMFFSRIDAKAMRKSQSSPFFVIIHPFLVGWVFFLVRGDMLSSVAYITGICCSIFVIFNISVLAGRFKL